MNGASAAYSNLAVGMNVTVEYAKCLSKSGFPCASKIDAKGTTDAATTYPYQTYSVGTSSVVLIDAAGTQSSGIVDAATMVTLDGAKVVASSSGPA